jgi:hypothetical protein
VYNRFPKRKSSALYRPLFVDRTALIPKNTVVIGLFPQGKLFPAPSGGKTPAPVIIRGTAGGNPPAINPDKDPRLHIQETRKGAEIALGKKNKTRFVTATGGTTFA